MGIEVIAVIVLVVVGGAFWYFNKDQKDARMGFPVGVAEEMVLQSMRKYPFKPITLYNKFKGLCEPLLIKHLDDKFNGVVIRPATVCGYAKRQRLDVVVNILTSLAFYKNEITVCISSYKHSICCLWSCRYKVSCCHISICTWYS